MAVSYLEKVVFGCRGSDVVEGVWFWVGPRFYELTTATQKNI